MVHPSSSVDEALDGTSDPARAAQTTRREIGGRSRRSDTRLNTLVSRAGKAAERAATGSRTPLSAASALRQNSPQQVIWWSPAGEEWSPWCFVSFAAILP